MPGAITLVGLSSIAGISGVTISIGIASVTLSVAAFSALVGMVVSFAISFVLQPDTPNIGAVGRAKDRLRNIKQPLSPHRVIYGKTRVGGTVTYLHTTDDDEELHELLTVAGHSIDGIESIYGNDELITLDSNNKSTAGKWKDQLYLWTADGTTSGDSDLLSAMVTHTEGHWTVDHKQEGLSKVYCRFLYDRDAYGNGIPNVTMIVRGKKLYDPRNATTAYSNNSALCILDYLRDSRYGLGEPDANIDMNSFITAANISDETVNLVDYTPSFEVLDPLSISEQSVQVTSSSHSVSIPSGHDGMFQEISIKAKKGSGKYTAFGALRLTVDGSTYNVGGRNSGETLTRCVYANGVTITSSSTYDKNDYYEVGNILDPNLGASHHSTDGYWLAVGDNTITITFDEALPITSISVINNPDNTYYGNRGSDLEFTFLPAPSIPASDISSGNEYVIHEIGTTDFTTIGASSNTVGVKFDATGAVSGTGRVFLSNFSEKRYTCNGTFETNDKPNRILKDLLSTCSGRLAYQGGKWALRVGAYVAPSMTFNEDDIEGSIEVVSQIGRREIFNQVQSMYTSPLDLYQPTDAPIVKNALYLAQDQYEVITRDMEFPFTTSSSGAQRLAKIELERVRQQISVVVTFSLKQGLKIQAGDTIGITNARMGWTNKAFVVEEWGMNVADESDNPRLVVGVILREIASNVFDWNLGQETTIDAAPDTNLSNSSIYDAPSNAVITEELVYLSAGTKGAGGTIEITCSWDNANKFINQFHVEFAVYDTDTSTWGDWQEGSYVGGLSWKVGSVPLGVYKFRVQGVSPDGRFTAWAESPDKTLGGLLDNPDDITTFGMDANEGHAAFLTWDEVDDLDVIHGGHLRVKHLPDSHSWDSAVDSIADGWTAASDIGKRITGITTEVLLPLRLGHYFIKAVDSSANESDNAVYVENTTEPKSTAEWLTGSGDPTSADGVVGDLWINTTSSKLWKKTSGTPAWVTVVSQLKGDDGEDGAGIEYIFAVTSDSSSTPSAPVNTWGFDQPVNPWYDGAPSVTASNKALWRAHRVIAGTPASGDSVSGTWSSPTVVGRFGADGASTTGATGRRTASGFLYYDTAQSSAPLSPTFSGSPKYVFSTGAFSSISSGWSLSTPTMQPSSTTSKYWAVHYNVIESSYGSSSQTITLGSVINSTNFDGVVTFTNNATGGSGTTHINGGKIATGTLSANTIASTNLTNGGTFALGSNDAIYSSKGVMLAKVTTSDSGFHAVMGIQLNDDTVSNTALVGGAVGDAQGVWGGNGFSTSNSTLTGTNTRAGVLGAGNSAVYAANLEPAVTAYAWLATDDGYGMRLTGGVAPFTGVHEALIYNDNICVQGDIVVDVEVLGTTGISDAVTLVTISSHVNQKGAVGVYNQVITHAIPVPFSRSIVTDDGQHNNELDPQFADVFTDRNVICMNSVGEGLINVVNQGGDISIGDLIVCSDINGKGMKQDDDIVRSYTVAKSRENIVFENSDEVKQVACIYMCG